MSDGQWSIGQWKKRVWVHFRFTARHRYRSLPVFMLGEGAPQKINVFMPYINSTTIQNIKIIHTATYKIIFLQ